MKASQDTTVALATLHLPPLRTAARWHSGRCRWRPQPAAGSALAGERVSA